MMSIEQKIDEIGGCLSYQYEVKQYYERHIICLDKDETLSFTLFERIKELGLNFTVFTYEDKFELQLWE